MKKYQITISENDHEYPVCKRIWEADVRAFGSETEKSCTITLISEKRMFLSCDTLWDILERVAEVINEKHLNEMIRESKEAAFDEQSNLQTI